MNSEFFHFLVLFVAAFLAGGINAIAGGGTLITFPALLCWGSMPRSLTPPARWLWPGLFGGLFGYRG
jgi:uncharacterized membrane protein YfcA